MRSQWAKVVVAVCGAAGLFAFTMLLLPSTAARAGAPTKLSAPAHAVTIRAIGATGSSPITVALASDLAWSLPAGWQAAVPTAVPTADAASTQGMVLLDAWQGAPRFEDADVRLRISRVPRHKLGLVQYADAAARRLAVEGYVVSQTAITTSLRADGLPAAMLVFGAAPIQGCQIVVFDPTGEHLLIVTMAAPAGRYAAAHDDLLNMLRWATHAQ